MLSDKPTTGRLVAWTFKDIMKKPAITGITFFFNFNFLIATFVSNKSLTACNKYFFPPNILSIILNG